MLQRRGRPCPRPQMRQARPSAAPPERNLTCSATAMASPDSARRVASNGWAISVPARGKTRNPDAYCALANESSSRVRSGESSDPT